LTLYTLIGTLGDPLPTLALVLTGIAFVASLVITLYPYLVSRS